jgi:hypothetical protein
MLTIWHVKSYGWIAIKLRCKTQMMKVRANDYFISVPVKIYIHSFKINISTEASIL